jgi:hypothetical protein
MRRDVSDVVAVFMPPVSPEQEIAVLRRQNRELEISVYVLVGLFVLMWLARR